MTVRIGGYKIKTSIISISAYTIFFYILSSDVPLNTFTQLSAPIGGTIARPHDSWLASCSSSSFPLTTPSPLSLCHPSSGWNRKPRIRHGPGSVRVKRTMVGKHDVQLSDVQRIAIALLRKSAILLLASRCCAPLLSHPHLFFLEQFCPTSLLRPWPEL
jgi:hypothetical protein